ncbi:MAG TPA: methyltransferase domain-containing protein [Thermoanaerobaculia bacterium]|jgi:SAM-dependent methyltransferase|nr:methyltransferase domain-containing protein [Thermoanaerobaculia bacterium]
MAAPSPQPAIDPAEVYGYLTRKEADMAFQRRAWTIFEWLGPTDGQTILDCGCGRGFYLKMLRHLGTARLFGIDLELPYLRKARRNTAELPAMLVSNASIYDLPFPDETFDAVLLSEILEHVDRDVDALGEVRRVLKPGGIALVTVPHADYPFWWDPINKTLETLFGTHIARGPLAGIWAFHVRLYTPEELRRAVLAAGFQIEEERAFTHHSFPFVHNLLYGLGKPLLESGLFGKGLADVADRASFDRDGGSSLHPVSLGLRMLNWIDRRNAMHEPPGRSTVNLCLKARKG